MPAWKPRAVADRRSIARHIAQDNPAAAVELVDLLLAQARLLDDSPRMGRAGRVDGTRELVAHPHYVIVYHVTGKPLQVEVLRVLHTSQQWP